MMKLFNTYVRSKIDYCCIVWSPWCQSDIDKVERIHCGSSLRSSQTGAFLKPDVYPV